VTTPLVLASGSRYRARLLAEHGWTVTVDPPDVDERAADHLLGELGPEGLALELARRKLAAVAPRHPGEVVVAADQVGVLGEGPGARMLTKAADPQAAVAQLLALGGTQHRLLNGLVVADTRTGAVAEGVDVQVVTMRPLSESEVRDYVARFEPFDTAGSYRLEDGGAMGPGGAFVTGVVGEDPSGVLGLPLPLLRRLLARVAQAGGGPGPPVSPP
jgi:septum formation protein